MSYFSIMSQFLNYLKYFNQTNDLTYKIMVIKKTASMVLWFIIQFLSKYLSPPTNPSAFFFLIFIFNILNWLEVLVFWVIFFRLKYYCKMTILISKISLNCNQFNASFFSITYSKGHNILSSIFNLHFNSNNHSTQNYNIALFLYTTHIKFILYQTI